MDSPAPVLGFTKTAIIGIPPLSVTFTTTGWKYDSILWDFGDGQTSTDINPVHSFAVDRVYTVTQTMTRAGVTASITQTVTALSKPTPDFSTNINGLTVEFEDTSSNNPTTHVWDMGETPLSLSKTKHTFLYPGTYQVKLTSGNASGSNVITKTVTVSDDGGGSSGEEATPDPIPGFTSLADENDSLLIHFTDTSSAGPTSWLWDFGDGSLSTHQNPSHTYTTGGTYQVKLTTSNAGGVTSIELPVVVTGPPILIPASDFSSSVPYANASLSLIFTDLSTNTPTSWLWDFGDGQTSTQKNPSHTYAIAGSYQVSLRATNQYGSDDEVKTVIVSAPVVPPASWTVTPNSIPVGTTARITLTASGFKSGSKIRVTQPENIGIVSKIISISSNQIVFDFLFDAEYLGVCGISVIPTNGTTKIFSNALTVA